VGRFFLAIAGPLRIATIGALRLGQSVENRAYGRLGADRFWATL
jgi:hypothetical protein